MIDGAMLIGATQEQALVRFSAYNPATNDRTFRRLFECRRC